MSQLLRSTPAVCRKCYVHPAVIEAFEAGELAEAMPASRRRGLRTDEAALAIFLEKDTKRRVREATRKNRSGDARLTSLLKELSRKARADALKASAKGVAAQALENVACKPASKAARPAAKKLARTRSSAAVAMS